jgi:hypothetical protein
MATNDALNSAYENQSSLIRNRVLLYVLSVWDGAGSYRGADIDRIIGRVVPAVRAGQLQLAALTDAYLSRVAREAGIVWTPSVRRDVVDYRGIPAAEVYRRPAVETYTALAAGASFDDATQRGHNRLSSIVSMDMQSARTRQAQASLGNSDFAGFRRVLTGKEDCALCVIASTQRYSKSDLMPIHPGCDCGVEPFAGDPSTQVIDHELLERTHADIDSRLGGTDRGARDLGLGKTDSSGRNLSDFTDLIVTREHGEYGPTLAWRSQAFTSAADIPAL